MKKLPILLCLSAFLVSCKKDPINVELPQNDVKTIQSELSDFSKLNEEEYFSLVINSKMHNNEYYYSVVVNKPKNELNNIKILLVDSDNRGYITFFGYDKDYSLILGEKKESNTRVIGININFHYSFDAKLFKFYSYFEINNQKKEVKYQINVGVKE